MARGPLPEATRALLIERGVLTPRGTSRRARLRACSNCGRAVVSGLDAPMMALDIDADPVPLTARGEVLAWLAGLNTYRLGTARVELDHRHARYSFGVPAMAVVVPQHQCEQPVPVEWRAKREEVVGYEIPDEPPF